MNLAPIALLGAAWWWLTQPRRNPAFFDPGSVMRGRGAEGAAERSAAARQLAALRGTSKRTIEARERRAAEQQAAVAAAEREEAERYRPVGVPRIKYRPHDFMTVRRGEELVRVPLHGKHGNRDYGLHERYQDTRTRDYARQIAETRTEANALRAQERDVKARASKIGRGARSGYLDAIEHVVKELGGSREKVAAFLPKDQRRWVSQTIEDPSEYVGDDADGYPIFRGGSTRTRKAPEVRDPRTGVPVGLHTGTWGRAFDQWLDAQRTRWRRVRDTDAARKGEAQYYLDVIAQFEERKRAATTGAREEESLLRRLARERAALDAKTERLSAEMAQERRGRGR